MKITFDEFDGMLGTDYITTIDTARRDKIVWEEGSMICDIAPWRASGCPLTLEIAITPSGKILHRGWDWSGVGVSYLHSHQGNNVIVTPEMSETVAGLFTGRIRVDGLRIAVGASVQEICPIDFAAEEQRTGKPIYFA